MTRPSTQAGSRAPCLIETRRIEPGRIETGRIETGRSAISLAAPIFLAPIVLAPILLTFGLPILPGVAQATPRTDAAASLAQAENQRSLEARNQAQARRDLAAARAQAARLASARASEKAALRTAERDAASVDARLAATARHQADTAADLAATQRAFATLMPALLRLSQSPDPALLAAPVPPDQTVQGLRLLEGLAVTLDRQAARLRILQTTDAAAQAATAREASILAAARAQQARRAAELDQVVAAARLQVSLAEADGRAAAQQAADAAAQARTLRDAIAAMDRQAATTAARAARDAALADRRHQPRAAQSARARQAALTRPPGAPLAQSIGRLIAPVAGPVQRPFGAAGDDGPATGITYATTSGVAVVSPCAGRVAFAAPFRSYGRLLIVECGGGYDIVLAGLGSLVAAPGHAARAGEVVGRMGAGPLYVELRAKGTAVDPAPFLTGKV